MINSKISLRKIYDMQKGNESKVQIVRYNDCGRNVDRKNLFNVTISETCRNKD